MGIVSAIVTYIIIWWTCIFCVLPFGLKRDETGKPENLNLARKMLITSGIAFILLGIVYALIEADIIDFYSIARDWAHADYGQ